MRFHTERLYFSTLPFVLCGTKYFTVVSSFYCLNSFPSPGSFLNYGTLMSYKSSECSVSNGQVLVKCIILWNYEVLHTFCHFYPSSYQQTRAGFECTSLIYCEPQLCAWSECINSWTTHFLSFYVTATLTVLKGKVTLVFISRLLL